MSEAVSGLEEAKNGEKSKSWWFCRRLPYFCCGMIEIAVLW
jgi:hypothetical protein